MIFAFVKDRKFLCVDLLVIVNLLLIITSWMVNGSHIGNLRLLQCVLIGMLYFLFRFIFSIFVKTIEYSILLISVICVYESILGLLQFLRFIGSDFYIFPCTGTFQNPGPYGGFIAICMCLLLSYVLLGKNKIIRVMCTISLIPSIMIFPSTMSRAAFVALGCSIIIMCLTIEKSRLFIKKYTYILTVLFLLAFSCTYFLKRQSANGRLFMNKISLRIMKSNGLFGVGLGGYSGAYGQAQSDYFMEKMNQDSNDIDWTVIPESERMVADCPERAFNEYLQLGVESGPISMICFLCIITSSIIHSYRNRNIWSYGLICFAIFSIFSYPLEYFQYVFLFPFLLASCNNDTSTKRSRIIILSSFVFLLIYILILLPRVKKEQLINRQINSIEVWYNMKRYDYVVKDCRDLEMQSICNIHYYFMYGKALQEIGEYSKSDSVLIIGAKMSSDPMFWNVMGNNNLALGNYREAERCYKQAFYMVPNRLYPLYLLAKLYYLEGDADGFLDMSDNVEKFKSKVESSRTKILRNELNTIKINLLKNEHE